MKLVLNLSAHEIKDLEVVTRLHLERVEEARANLDGLYSAVEERRIRKIHAIFEDLRSRVRI